MSQWDQLKPPITYFGGKTRIAERITDLFPAHSHYVELFGGSLAVLLAKRPARHETVNDLDRSLMTFWRVLRDRPDDLQRVCALTPHARAEHAATRLDLVGDLDADELETARCVWVQLTQGRGGHTNRPTGWRHYQDGAGSSASMPDYLASYVARIAPCAVRLASVSLECRPALELVEKYGQHGDVLLYADPPYPALARGDSDRRYRYEMLDEPAHRELAAALHGARAGVLISGYESPLYSELYGDWHRREIVASAGVGDGEQRARLEIVWSNRPFPVEQPGLFDEPS